MRFSQSGRWLRCWMILSAVLVFSHAGAWEVLASLSAPASTHVTLRLQAREFPEVGQPFHLDLLLQSAVPIGGYETVLTFDVQRLHLDSAQHQGGLRTQERAVVPLGPVAVRGGVVLGAATCSTSPCGAPAQAHVGIVTGVTAPVQLATLTLTPQVGGPLTVWLADTKVVDTSGRGVSASLAPQAFSIQVAPGTPRPWSPQEAMTYPVLSRAAYRSAIRPSSDLTHDRRVDAGDAYEAALEWRLSRRRGELCGSAVLAGIDLVADTCFDIADVQAVAAHIGTTPVAQGDRSEDSEAIWIVNTTADDDDAQIGDGICATATARCTLRAALREANAHVGADTIHFTLPGTGVHTIQLASRLPTLSDQTGGTRIDGATQPGAVLNTSPVASTAEIAIEVRGQGVTAFDAIHMSSANNVLRGLALYNLFTPIEISSVAAQGNTLIGNFIGTNAEGTFRLSAYPDAYGINVIHGAANTVIGTAALADRNVIGGNANDGVSVFDEGTTGTRIVNNIIGLHPNGIARLPNGADGIDLNVGAQRTQIGGLAPGERNVISGNTGDGIEISHQPNTAENTVQGNFIGTDLMGRGNQPALTGNGEHGITLEAGVSNNLIGPGNIIVANGVSQAEAGIEISGFTEAESARGNRIVGNHIGVDAAGIPAGNHGPGIKLSFWTYTTLIAENIIAHNTGAGVSLPDHMPRFNTFSRNRFVANGGLGIDLGDDGVTPNDPGDGDSGPNQRLNFPVLTSVTTTQVSGGQACAGCLVEVYRTDGGSDPNGEGTIYLGSATADSGGQFSMPVSACVLAGQRLTATATDGSGNTSEFALNAVVAPGPTPIGLCIWLPVARG